MKMKIALASILYTECPAEPKQRIVRWYPTIHPVVWHQNSSICSHQSVTAFPARVSSHTFIPLEILNLMVAPLQSNC